MVCSWKRPGSAAGQDWGHLDPMPMDPSPLAIKTPKTTDPSGLLWRLREAKPVCNDLLLFLQQLCEGYCPSLLQ